ncbi:Pycsar system effector family protein [Terrabacter sp. C0L_2]|uniref:Pycsar system effector family protein n=1 Tax=Terrabacter sp. C0L_2 TaxID=3108389 RepID=UPI002ED20E0A|nr:Pycsar system effector family protein [Terrabacter sp. C0L_2]
MTEEAWRLLGSTNEWLRYADAKAAGALAGAGVLGGVLVQSGLDDANEGAPGGAIFFFVVAALAVFASATFALIALAPRLKVGEPNSLIYFDHVARKYVGDPDGHAAAVKTLLEDGDALFSDLAAQVWANSTVARKKFFWSGWAIFLLGLGLLLAGIAGAFTVR